MKKFICPFCLEEVFEGTIQKRCEECGEKMQELEVLGVWSVCNTISLNVYLISSEKILVGYNNETPYWKDFNWDKEGNMYINIGDMDSIRYYLNECIAV